jgi:hypothetical protein
MSGRPCTLVRMIFVCSDTPNPLTFCSRPSRGPSQVLRARSPELLVQLDLVRTKPEIVSISRTPGGNPLRTDRAFPTRPLPSAFWYVLKDRRCQILSICRPLPKTVTFALLSKRPAAAGLSSLRPKAQDIYAVEVAADGSYLSARLGVRALDQGR